MALAKDSRLKHTTVTVDKEVHRILEMYAAKHSISVSKVYRIAAKRLAKDNGLLQQRD